MLYKTGKPEMLRALVGEEITKEFVAFCNQRVITLEDVLNDRFDEDEIAVLNTSEKYATAMGLSSVDEKNFEKVRKFVGNLGKEFTSLFDNLWAKNDESRLEKVAEIKMDEEELEKETKQIEDNQKPTNSDKISNTLGDEFFNAYNQIKGAYSAINNGFDSDKGYDIIEDAIKGYFSKGGKK